jgi:surface antigen
MIDPRPVLLLATALALGGCDLTSKSGASEATSTSAFSGGNGPTSNSGDRAAASNALTNAELARLIGTKIGAALNDDDRRLAYEAQIKALESGSPGAPMPWRNPASGRYGNIVPGPAYDRKGAQCRGYSHSVHINGQLEIARGTACRSTDGVWSAVG